ncbi:alpha-hydroxy acid oxidase [Chelativorans sp.]|uniref:alpha-hydroxy acid oxidase n=1 Tax=Chelativorans sp. TaxID=2203393 RepID=UPI002811FF52|nr:alpha-hydroxy acid oxidase [Chelativorans sp.]
MPGGGDTQDLKLEGRLASLRRRYPSIDDLERRARRRIPHFAYEFIQGGAGDESGLTRNRAALRGIEVVPRYGMDVSKVDTTVELFGRRYAAPIGISPIGFDGLMWPGATQRFARAAQASNIPYLVGTLATATIEKVAEWAPDVTWFQLYPLPADDHRVSFDLAARAEAAGAKVLVATLDVPVRVKRPRDLRNGFVIPFRMSPKHVLDALLAVPWLFALAREGMPRFANIERYSGSDGDAGPRFVQQHVGGGFTWEALARVRDKWPRPMLVKGVMHPDDAERAMQLGMDGVIVSNHGGRQFDAAPASIDVLPHIARTVGKRGTVMLDSGVTSGVDMLRAIACGAQGTFAGRAFMLGLAALGDHGATHVARAFVEEFGSALGQSGITDVATARRAPVRHPTAWTKADFERWNEWVGDDQTSGALRAASAA